MLTIRTLGHVCIELDSHPLHFETRTVAALLIYLACQRQPASREVLAELFWPERTQKQARSNLRVALHRLRQPVVDYLLITQSSVALNWAATIKVDATHFESQLTAGRLAEATTLYTGDFLADFYLDGSPAFEQWALLERERLRIRALAAYQQLIDQRAATGELAVATRAAQRLLQLDPLHEPTHRQLMRLLAQSGQRSAALAQYETCRQLLTAELAVLPDETTTALAEQIRSNDFRFTILDPSRTSFGLPAPPVGNDNLKSKIVNPKLNNLPPQPTPFIGRGAELTQIAQLLANPDCRLLTLLGVGGIGKTRLAVETAQRILDFRFWILDSDAGLHTNPKSKIGNPKFEDGVCFVALAPVETAELVTVTIAQSLGLQISSSDLLAEIAAYVGPRHLLLVLDNFEHLLAAADNVAHLLQHAPHLKVLVTSRERLYLREEWLLPITGLSVSGESVAGGPVAGEAEQLFLHSAQRVQPGFRAQGQEAAIATVCRQVEGMPLALELAASWVRVMPCAEIARQIQANFDFLTTAVRNLPERHRSMRALFDQSWRLLSPVEQGILMRLSVFRGGWQMEEAAQILDFGFAILDLPSTDDAHSIQNPKSKACGGTIQNLLLGLVDKSLVRVNGQQRFDLHELVRQYAAEQLAASGESELIRQRHYAAYLQLFRTGDSHLRGTETIPWIARLDAEQDNLRAAMQWALDAARYTDAAWLMVAANWFLEHRGYHYAAERWLTQLLPHRQLLETDLRLTILLNHNAFAHVLEASQPIDRHLDELMALQASSSAKLLQAAAWFFSAQNATDFAQTALAYEQAITLARAAREAPKLGPEFCLLTDGDFILGTTLAVYAGCLIDQGEVTRAAACARESFRLFQASGSFEQVGGLGWLGVVALLQGDLGQAHRLLHEVVTVATATKSHETLGQWQPLLGLVTLYRGDVAEARRLLHESLRLCVEMKGHLLAAPACTYLAETALWAGDLVQAEQWLTQSLGYHADPRRVTIHEIGRLWVAASLATEQQHYPRAATLFGLAEQAHSQIHYAIGGPMRTLAEAALATVRSALGPVAFAEAFATGQQMSLEGAFATVLASKSTATAKDANR